MSCTAVVGAQFGDEGKGKIVDALAKDHDWVVRFQGGANAGHTLATDTGPVALHQVPCGALHAHVQNALGPGVALDPRRLLPELEQLERRLGREVPLRISERCQILHDGHVRLDQLREEHLAERAFGSTRAGIAPFFAAKHDKLGVPVLAATEPGVLRALVERWHEQTAPLFRDLYDCEPPDVDALCQEIHSGARALEPRLCDTRARLGEAIERGGRVLLEGQLGALRDPDWGIYPYVTSSSTLAGHAVVGAGVPPGSIERVVAVAKAYGTCVGAGPLVGELEGEAAAFLRRLGNEVGATTGRVRRVSWLDAVALRYGCETQSASEVALTMLDVLSGAKAIPVCVRYRVGDATLDRFPATHLLDECQPEYVELPGFSRDISECRSFESLPRAARGYVELVETLTGLPVTLIGVGPRREQLIRR